MHLKEMERPDFLYICLRGDRIFPNCKISERIWKDCYVIVYVGVNIDYISFAPVVRKIQCLYEDLASAAIIGEICRACFL